MLRFRIMLRALCGRIARLEPLLVLLLVLLLLLPGRAHLAALGVVPLLWLCAWAATGQPVRRTPVDWSLLILLAAALAGTFAGRQPDKALTRVAGIVVGLAVYYALARAAGARHSLWPAAHGFALAAGAFALLGLVGTAWLPRVVILRDVTAALPNLTAPLGFRIHHNSTAGGLLLLALPVLGLLAGGRGPPDIVGRWPVWGRRLLLGFRMVALGLASLVLLLTQSRGGWLGFAVGLAGFLTLHNARTRRALAAAVAAALLLVLLLGPGRIASLAAGAGVTGGFAGHLITRPALWTDALETISAYPLTGMGLRDFGGDFSAPPPAPFAAWPELYHGHPHNVFLGVGVDLGLLGLAAYVALWLGALVMLLRARRRAAEPWLGGLAEGLLAAWIAYSTFGLTDSITFNARVGIAFWLALGLAAAVHQAASAPPARPGGRNP